MGDRVLYEFEFNLRQELINKLIAVEPFTEKWDFKNLENRVSNSNDGAKLESCLFMHHSLIIEKTTNEESKLVVKIYDIAKELTSKDGESQTELIETKNERLQTNSQNFVSCRIQVQPDVQNHRTQTTSVQLTSAEVQTDESRLHLELADKAIESDFNIGTQIDKDVWAGPVLSESECQATATTAESECQNVVLVESIEIQTEQNISSNSSQTDIKELCHSLCQTSSSIAREMEASVQAVCETKEQDSQVLCCLNEMQSQTDMSMSSQKHAHMQATADMEVSCSQTEIPTNEMETETEFNLLTQCHVETQNFTEVIDANLQTDCAEGMDSGCLTDHNLSTQESKNMQAGEDMTNDVSDLVNLDDSILDRSQHNVSSINNSSSGDRFTDGVSQTDPVTIIIGDASFLVQKLKSSAMNATKVTTSGNEIEIELSADLIDLEIPQQVDRNQNQAKIIPLEIKPTLPEVDQTPPKVAAPRVGGVRMRMPISTTPYAPNAGKMAQPAFQARAPNATSIVSPQAKAHVSHQNKPSAGLFSCPFCNLCFIESPALYEHLSDAHQSDLKSKWKKSQGREGKTIIPRNNQQNKKPTQEVAKATGKTGLAARVSDSGNAASSWHAGKRKKTFTNISRKYRRMEDDDEEDDDDDDEDYDEDEEYVVPRGRL